jgi:hypothetical protein
MDAHWQRRAARTCGGLKLRSAVVSAALASPLLAHKKVVCAGRTTLYIARRAKTIGSTEVIYALRPYKT